MVEELCDTKDASKWNLALPARRSVFGCVEFAEVTQEFLGQKAWLYILKDGNDFVTYPLRTRRIGELPFTMPWAGERVDIVTPEYTGPMRTSRGRTAISDSFRERFRNFCAEFGVVSEFCRLHPWDSDPSLFDGTGMIDDRKIAFVDLTRTEEEIWSHQYRHCCRQNIRRARNAGVRVFSSSSRTLIDEFWRLYDQTMTRRRALDSYRFTREYFHQIAEAMPRNSVFFFAEYRDRIISAVLFLYDDASVYSYLGGSDLEFQLVRPSNILYHEAILWARTCFRSRLVLGGGYQPNDGIFRFKTSFSRHIEVSKLYRSVHCRDTYERLCAAWSRFYKKDVSSARFFPPYWSLPTE